MALTNLAEVEARFARTLRPARDLINIHKRKPGQGRRVADLSLNKGAVVFAVAAWQGYVQDLSREILSTLAPPPADPSAGMYRLLAGRVREQIKRYNTPNAQNTLDLFSLLGFDPSDVWGFGFAWEWQRSARRPNGSVTKVTTLSSANARKELDAWLLIRHRIAHGDALPADPERVTGTDHGEPQLMRRNADRCVKFFHGLVMSTSAAALVTFP
jgi:hypothetical protein